MGESLLELSDHILHLIRPGAEKTALQVLLEDGLPYLAQGGLNRPDL
jgi:hypothetical protein